MSIQLDECPFCLGDKAEARHLGTGWAVVCLKCYAQGPHSVAEVEAAKAWNDQRIKDALICPGPHG